MIECSKAVTFFWHVYLLLMLGREELCLAFQQGSETLQSLLIRRRADSFSVTRSKVLAGGQKSELIPGNTEFRFAARKSDNLGCRGDSRPGLHLSGNDMSVYCTQQNLGLNFRISIPYFEGKFAHTAGYSKAFRTAAYAFECNSFVR